MLPIYTAHRGESWHQQLKFLYLVSHKVVCCSLSLHPYSQTHTKNWILSYLNLTTFSYEWIQILQTTHTHSHTWFFISINLFCFCFEAPLTIYLPHASYEYLFQLFLIVIFLFSIHSLCKIILHKQPITCIHNTIIVSSDYNNPMRYQNQWLWLTGNVKLIYIDDTNVIFSFIHIKKPIILFCIIDVIIYLFFYNVLKQLLFYFIYLSFYNK